MLHWPTGLGGLGPRAEESATMCNLYSLTKGQAAIRDWFRARHDRIEGRGYRAATCTNAPLADDTTSLPRNGVPRHLSFRVLGPQFSRFRDFDVSLEMGLGGRR